MNKIISILLVFFLTGCVSIDFGKDEEIRHINLEPQVKKLEGKKVSWQLIIDPPAVDPSLDTDRVVVFYPDGSASFIRAVNWTRPLPALIEDAVSDAFLESGLIMGVSRMSSDLKAKYILKLDVDSFNLNALMGLEGVPRVEIKLTAQLIEIESREVVRVKTFKYKKMAENKSFKSISSLFNKLCSEAFTDLVEWTLLEESEKENPRS